MDTSRTADLLFRAYLGLVAVVAIGTYAALATSVDASIGGGLGLIVLLVAGLPWSIAYGSVGESNALAVVIVAAAAALNGFLVRYRPQLLP